MGFERNYQGFNHSAFYYSQKIVPVPFRTIFYAYPLTPPRILVFGGLRTIVTNSNLCPCLGNSKKNFLSQAGAGASAKYFYSTSTCNTGTLNKYNNLSPNLNPFFVTGLIDGEGYFTVSIQKSKDIKVG